MSKSNLKYSIFNKRRIFLCLCLLAVPFFLLWPFLNRIAFGRIKNDNFSTKPMYLRIEIAENTIESNEIKAPLLVDVDCLKKLMNSDQNCEFPIKLAFPVGQQFDYYYDYEEEADFTRTEYHLIDDPARNYWFFLNTKNPNESVATKRFKTKLASLHLGYGTVQLEVPADLHAFTRVWRNGRFIECHPILTRPQNVERRIPLSFLDNLVKYADLIDQFNATAFIFAGTLLGWRRECSIIPHTTDTDMAIFHEEHSDALLRAIITSPTFRIEYIIGRLRDSFELAVNVDGIKIDLYHLYNDGNRTFANAMRSAQRKRLRYTYPRLSGKICAGELHGRLVHVPCDYQKVIEADYGPEWQKDWHTDSFIWDKSHKNRESMETYTEDEWKYVHLSVVNRMDRFDPVKVEEWMANINKTA